MMNVHQRATKGCALSCLQLRERNDVCIERAVPFGDLRGRVEIVVSAVARIHQLPPHVLMVRLSVGGKAFNVDRGKGMI